ncbi:MAG TPA: hypothetical protein VF698_09705, partial [Thermoanaerobaculia bacterium]
AEGRYLDFGSVRRFEGGVVAMRASSSDAVREELNQKGDGRVLVVDATGVDGAIVGYRSAHLAHQNGWSGIVVEGFVRDARDLRHVGIGVKAIGTMPRRATGTFPPERAATLGGLTVSSGEYLYADEDGIVVTARPVKQ